MLVVFPSKPNLDPRQCIAFAWYEDEQHYKAPFLFIKSQLFTTSTSFKLPIQIRTLPDPDGFALCRFFYYHAIEFLLHMEVIVGALFYFYSIPCPIIYTQNPSLKTNLLDLRASWTPALKV